MNNFIFENKTKVYFGKGCVGEYLPEIAAVHGDKVLLAYGGGSIKKNGVYEEALMVEPTETESKETLDEAVEVLRKLYEIAETDAEQLHQAPVTTPVTRMDEVGAARHPYLRYEWQD